MILITIEENDANQRLDKFLKKLFPAATRSLIYKLNRKGKIKVSITGEKGKYKKRDNEYKLEPKQKIKFFLSQEEFVKLSESGKEEKWETHFQKFDQKNIVYEDGSLLVINKESGINVHPGDHKTNESNVIAQVQDYLWGKYDSLTFKPSLVHRIDRDTSGILLIAKKKDLLTRLVKDFKNHKKVKKTYYAIVLGKLAKRKGTIKDNLERIENAKWENKVQISKNGKEAITHYKLLKEHILRTQKEVLVLSEVEIEIETGRMHQIRVHMASVWNPLLGDKKYGDKQLNGFFANHYGLYRQALHAWKIEFFHYEKDKKMKLTAKIKEDLQTFISKISA